MCIGFFFAARIVQGTAAVDFRLPEAARPVCVTGPGDEIFNRGFCWCRRSTCAAGSKNTVNIINIVIFTRCSEMTFKASFLLSFRRPICSFICSFDPSLFSVVVVIIVVVVVCYFLVCFVFNNSLRIFWIAYFIVAIPGMVEL